VKNKKVGSGFTLTLTPAHIEALIYAVGAFKARANAQDAAHQRELLDCLRVSVFGLREHITFPYATLPLLLSCLKHASYCLDASDSAAKLRRQARRVRDHLAESAVDRLGALAG